MPEEKPKCPECEVELVEVNGSLPEKCQKCGFRLKGFRTFQRWFKVAAKAYEKAEKKPTTTDDDEFSFLDEL